MISETNYHRCPDPGCAARGHAPFSPIPAVPTFPAFPTVVYPNYYPATVPTTPAVPAPATSLGAWWSSEALSALMDAVRAAERQAVLAEIKLCQQFQENEDASR
jgi:hypothetical protein